MPKVIPLQRKKKIPKLNMHRINNNVFADARLSWAAKGIYTYLMITGTQINVDMLKGMAPGDIYVAKAVRELIDNGYVDVVGR